MVSSTPGLRFSDHFNVTRTDADDWFDLVLLQDTAMAVDPYLVFEDDDPRWANAQSRVFDFFEMVKKLAAGDKSSQLAAVKMLCFKEPYEVCLGKSTKLPYGSGIGPSIATPMATLLTQFQELSTDNPCANFEIFNLFQPGIAFDGMSDMIINILKSDLIRYTQDVAIRHGVPMDMLGVLNGSWTSSGRWLSPRVKLPVNQALTDHDRARQKKPLILVPERWLREIKRPDDDHVTSWFEESEAAEALRDTLSRDIRAELTRRENRARLVAEIRNHPDMVQAWIDHLATLERQGYDIANDPKGVVRYPEKGVDLFRSVKDDKPAIDPEKDFCGWLGWLVGQFQRAVEKEGGWKPLWERNRNAHVVEDVTQSVANMFFRAFCHHLNIQISREVEVGRGRVDFHLSVGKAKSAVIEVKHMGNSKIGKAVDQIVTYCDSGEISCGYLLCIGFNASDLRSDEKSKRYKLEQECREHSEAGHNIRLVIVDATPKATASKL